MAENKGGYARPSATTAISADYNNHRYGRNPASSEPGTDYPCAYGSAIYAPEDGVIANVDNSAAGAEGRRLCVKHPDGQMTSSIHLSRILVSNGQQVKRGQEIAKSGASAWGKEWGVGAHVHETLFPTHNLVFGTTRTLDFEKQVGADNDGGGGSGLVFNQDVANRQNFLNAAQGEKLVVDGLPGGNTIAAVKRYQTYLAGRNWYSGDIDGIWGKGTQAGHEKRYSEWAQGHATPSPQYHTATVADLGTLTYKKGLQKVANLYLKQPIDNIWGDKSNRGMQLFLNQNYGGSLAAWLRQKYGYVGNDQWGPVMAAAAGRAQDANWRAL